MTLQEVRERQGWTLDQKIDHSLGVIEQFYNHCNGKVYISFSGGKDSTVLFWLARKLYPDIRAVFCNTRNEYPDIVKFVHELKRQYNVEIIVPRKTPKEIMEINGFPLVSKEASGNIYTIRVNPNSKKSKKLLGIDDLDGKYRYDLAKKWRWLIDEKFTTSNVCCEKLKKYPFEKYERQTGLSGILGTMASESNMRMQTYIRRGGCNVFKGPGIEKSRSLPLSIWMEEDIWKCIEKYNIPISEIYHKGAKRTGCCFCGYGCQYKDHNSLQLVYDLYPKMYELFMGYTNNGVTYREALRKVLAVNGLYLPDEKPVQQLDMFE